MPFIYKIISPIGKIYIGSSINAKRRFRHHGGKKQLLLHASFKEYGKKNHSFEIIIECSDVDRFRLEAEYGHSFDVLGANGLNSSLPKHPNFEKSIRKELSFKISHANTGKKHTEESKQKMSKWQIGRKMSSEAVEKMANSKKGKRYKQLNPNPNKIRPCSKIVVNLQSGIFYDSAKFAADAHNMNHSTLKCKLNGQRTNKTYLIYT